jgi:hypothetical protein
MKPDISEFSYGYTVTEELVAKAGATVIAAPIFPSLYQEGQKGGGYDVQIPLKGSPIFLQFKLSDHLKRSSAKEHKAGLLSIPYYRMHLRPLKHSDQHNLLLALEASGETVFYIAPEFHLPDELNKFYLSRTVVNCSAAFSPLDIGKLPNDGDHYIAFEKGSSFGFRCSSDPKKVPRVYLRDGFKSAVKARGIEARALGLEGIRELSASMLRTIERAAPIDALQVTPPHIAIPGEETETSGPDNIEGARLIVESRSPIESAAYLARTFFGCELIVVK